MRARFVAQPLDLRPRGVGPQERVIDHAGDFFRRRHHLIGNRGAGERPNVGEARVVVDLPRRWQFVDHAFHHDQRGAKEMGVDDFRLHLL